MTSHRWRRASATEADLGSIRRPDPGGGIAAAEHLFAGESLVGLRRIIDVSGDGTQNIGEVATTDAQHAAVSHGVTINGLPIGSGEQPRIEEWYRANVVGGLGVFLIIADSYDAFAEAFRRKLTLEISGRLSNSQLAAASQ